MVAGGRLLDVGLSRGDIRKTASQTKFEMGDLDESKRRVQPDARFVFRVDAGRRRLLRRAEVVPAPVRA